MGLFKKKETQQEPPYYTSRTNTQVLNYNVYQMKASEKTLYGTILFVAGGLIGLVFYGGLFKSEGKATLMTFISNIIVFVIAGILATKSFIPTINDSLRKKRIGKLKKQFCDFSSGLTNALAGGMNMNDSINAVYLDLQSQYSNDAYIVQEVQEIINGINNNIPIETMIEDFGKRSGIPDIVNFANVFSTCYRTGGNIKSVLRRTTEIISEKVMISSEIETAMTSNKLQMNIMNFLPVIIVFMMRMMSSSFSEGFSTIIGVIGLSVSVALTIVSYKLGKKITDIKE